LKAISPFRADADDSGWRLVPRRITFDTPASPMANGRKALVGPLRGPSGLVEVFGLDAEELVDGGAQGGVAGELRVGRDQGGGFLPGQADQVLVGEQPEQAQAGVAAGLGGAEDVALAALLKVEPGQLEPVECGR